MNETGSVLVYSTYVGGTSSDYGYGLAVDGSGCAYITGYTLSSNFPTTIGCWDYIYNSTDVFVTKLNASGSALVYSTYLGGTSSDYGYGGIAVDASGCAYVSGYTSSSNFPTTSGCWDNTYNSYEIFVTKFNPAGSSLVYSTYLGGNSLDYGYGIAVDELGRAIVGGYTYSSDYPVTADAFQRTYSSIDAIFTILKADGTGLEYSTYLGGTSSDYGYYYSCIARGGSNTIIVGYTSSTNFPTTSGAYKTTSNGGYDGFITAFDLEPRTITLGTVSPSQFCPGDEYQNITVSFSLSGTFISGNVFTAQISDQNGSFTNPQTIGILMGTTSGVINCSLPVLEVNKTYFIRIVSSKPSIISDAFGPIIINPLPEKFRVIGSGIYCVNDAKGALIELERSQANTLYQLKFNGNNIGSPVAGTGNKISFGYYTAEGDYTAEAISHHGCKAMMQGAVQVKKIQLPKEFSMLGGGQFYNEPGDGTYCDGDIGVGIGLSGSEQNFEYILKLNGTKVISTRIGTGTDFSFGYFTEEGTYTVSAQLIGGGCTNNMKGSITVRKIPAPQKYTLTTSGKYCEGEAGVDILLNGSQPGVLYQLQFNGENIGNLINGTGSSINFGVFKDPGIYTAIATSTNMGCATQMNGEVSPEMIPKPVAYDIAGIDYFCKGSEGPEITLSNSEVGVMYQLMLDGRPIGNPISGTGSSISFGKQNIVGLYTIGATRIEGNCTNEMNGSINLREIPSPEISITGNMTPKFGGNENYTDESAGEGDQYVWTVLGGKINGSNTSASINVNWGNNKKGKVRVTKTNSYGCTSTSEVDINLINNIVADFEVDKIKGEVPLTVNFTDKSEGYITFREWDFGDGYSSPLVNPGHVYKIPGKYTVKLTVGYGDVFIDKIKTDLITAENVLSVDESSANLISKNGISISAIEPNPSSDVIRFTYGVNTPQNISIAIYNIYGERVMAISDGYISEGTYNKEMDISNLPSGAYYLQILGKDGQVNQMISVVR
ncbi:MAG: SBBP repeat-containing protein [Chloroherpetonaceae bacterium]